MNKPYIHLLHLAFLVLAMTVSTAFVNTAVAGTATITSFAPTSGCSGSLPLVTITGTNFTGVTAVTFGGVAAASYTVVSATSITATPASGTATGIVSVTTTTNTANSAGSFTVNPILVPSTTVSATATTICSGTSVTFTPTPTNGGTTPTYQWYKNGTATVATTTYTSAALANNDSVWVVMTSNATCATPTKDTSTHTIMTVNALVAPSVTVSASPGTTVCAGTSVTYTANPVNGGITPTYQWKKGGVVITGATSSTYTYVPVNGDVITVVMTSNATCPSPATATSANTTMTVTALVTPSVSVAATATTICAGTSVTFTATPTNGGAAPAYQWYLNGSTVGTSATTYVNAALANGDSVWVVLTSNANCASPTTATSAHKIMTVNATVTPSVSVATNTGTSVCAGTSVTFTATPTNGGTTPTYQWKKGGVVIAGATASTYTYVPTNGNVITVVMTSNATCPSPATATSPNTTMAVTANLVPLVAIAATATTICSGTSVTFTATPTNGGAIPVYQWYKNGSAVGTNAATYVDAALANNDSVWVVLTSSYMCPTPPTATSTHKIMTVNALTPTSVSIAATATTICSGTSVTFTATPTGGGTTPTYKWYRNVTGGVTTSTYTTTALANKDSVWVIVTSNATCPSPAKDTSTHVKMTVNAVLVPSVTVAATATTICAGTSVTFTATPTNGGATPSYQWYKNSVAVGTNSATYTDAGLNNNDNVWVVMTSSYVCPSTPTATSAHKVMTVNAYVIPSTTIAATATTICTGTSVTFTPTPTNGGTTPTYKWYKNGVNIVNTTTYTSATLANNDSVWVIMTNNATCPTQAKDTSAHIKMTVNAKPVPVITASGPTSFCPGSNVILTASGGTSYVWSNAKTTSKDTVTAAATYTVTATNAAGCTATAASVITVYSPAVVVTSNSPVCLTNTINLLATPSGGTTYTYSWSGPASFSSTVMNPSRASAVRADTGIYSVTVTDNHGCTSTGTTDIAVNSDPPNSSFTICNGSAFNATPSGFSSLITYSWSAPSISPSGSITGASAQTNASIPGQTLTNTTSSQATATYTITPSSSCTGASYIVTVNVNGTIGIPSSATPAAICSGGLDTITGTGSTGASSYSFWTAATGGSAVTTSTTPPGTVSGNSLITPTTLAGGTYTYYVEGDNGSCASTSRQAVTITINTTPSLPSGPLVFASPACNLASVSLSGASSSYYWETSSTGTNTLLPSTSPYTITSTGGVFVRAYTGLCWSVGADSTGTVTVDAGGSLILPSSSALGTTESCGDTSGWTYYAPSSNLNNWMFAINKNGNNFTANVDITIDPAGYEVTADNTQFLATITMGRYWNVTVTSGSINGSTNPVSVRFFYDPADTSAMRTESDYYNTLWHGSSLPYEWFKTTTGITYDPANNGYSNIPNKLNPGTFSVQYGTLGGLSYVEYDGLQGFSGGTGLITVMGNTSLPVQLISLTAAPVDNSYIRLNWATASESNNSGFDIERSVNGVDFEKVGFVQGHGTTSSQNDYQYPDQSADPNITYYYRLRQIDIDGKYTFSKIVSALLIGHHGFIMDNLKPNPASSLVTVNTVATEAQDATVSLVDMLGRVLIEQSWQMGPGLNGTQLDVSKLAPGTYTVSVSGGSYHFSKTLVIAR